MFRRWVEFNLWPGLTRHRTLLFRNVHLAFPVYIWFRGKNSLGRFSADKELICHVAADCIACILAFARICLCVSLKHAKYR